MEARRTTEAVEEGATEAHRKIGTVGPDEEVTATGDDTTRQEATAPASEVAEHILVHHACEEPPRKPAPKPVPFSDAARAALAAQHAELRSSYEISRLHQVGSTVFKDLDYPA